MLDFYLISDDQPKPRNPKQIELQFVGRLDYDCFEGLKLKGFIANQFDYCSDFRWGTNQIKLISEMVNKSAFQPTLDVKRLTELLDIAVRNNSGLLAYGD